MPAWLPTVCVAVMALIVFAALHRMALQADRAKNWEKFLQSEIRDRNARIKALERYEDIARSFTGGAAKRLAETREIAEAILTHAPEAFAREKGLVYWLEAHDQFLTEMYEIYREGINPEDADNVATAYGIEVYLKIHEVTGLPLPRQADFEPKPPQTTARPWRAQWIRQWVRQTNAAQPT